MKTSSISSFSNDLIKLNQTSSHDISKLSSNEKLNQYIQDVSLNETRQSFTRKGVSLNDDFTSKEKKTSKFGEHFSLLFYIYFFE